MLSKALGWHVKYELLTLRMKFSGDIDSSLRLLALKLIFVFKLLNLLIPILSLKKIIRNTVLRRFEYDYNMFHVHYAVIRLNIMALKKLYIDRATNVWKKRRRQRL